MPAPDKRRGSGWNGATGVTAGIAGVVLGASIVLLAMHARPPRPGRPAVVAAVVTPPGAVVATTSRAVPSPAAENPRKSAPPAATDRLRELRQMKEAADDLAADGDFQGAYTAYKTVAGAAADGPPESETDPEIRRIRQAAEVGQNKTLQILIAAARSKALRAETVATSEPTYPQGGIGNAARRARTADVAPQNPPLAGLVPATPPPPTADDIRQAADNAPALPGDHPRPQLRSYLLPGQVTDEQIGTAIHKAVHYLRTQPHGFVTLPQNGRNAFVLQPPANADQPLTPQSPLMPGMQLPQGTPLDFADAEVGDLVLATYALLNAGRAADEPGLGVRDHAVVSGIEALKSYPLTRTYTRSLRASALAVYDRPEDAQAIEQDCIALIAASHDGGYSYPAPTVQGPTMSRSIARPIAPPQTEHVALSASSDQTALSQSAYGRRQSATRRPNELYGDNSNSQYGVLGVWAAAQCGFVASDSYWNTVTDRWSAAATAEGRWGYSPHPGEVHLSMTLAGITSLLVSHDYLEASLGPGGRLAYPPALVSGLNWLETGDNCVYDPRANNFVASAGYTNYGLERVGLATGFKYFGQHDWYSEGAAKIVAAQFPQGEMGGGVVETSFNLLFLARGRAPLIFNKLRYDGDWDNRPNDVAHLARFATQQLERPMNWQAVDLGHPWTDWTDAPVLYISGDKPPVMTDADMDAIRDYALGGGLVFTHADGGSKPFTKWVEEFVRREFPKYELMSVPKDHPLNSAMYRLKNPPVLKSVGNGSRLLLVHSETDVAGGWLANWSGKDDPSFQAGMNLFVYAAGRSEFHNRLSSTFIPPPPDALHGTVPVARLRFAGEWDPEPYAWTRFTRYFNWEAHAGLNVKTIDLKALTPGEVPAAFVTGTVRQDFTAEEAAAARAYVEAGGVLVIDACGGREAFAYSAAKTLIAAAFPDASLAPLPDNHPALVPGRPCADDLRTMHLREFAVERLNTSSVPLEGLRFGKGWVIFSRLDLTTGLLGTRSWGILGYDSADAQALMKNTILWGAARSGVGSTAHR